MQRESHRIGKFMPIALIAVFGFVLVGVPARADDEGAFKYRQSVMRALAGHAGAAAAVIKGQVDFKSQLAMHAHAIAAIGKIAKDLFPKGSNVADSRALPAIWEKPAEFTKAVAAFESASANFAAVAVGGNMQATATAFGELGRACSGCHQNFRRKK